MEDFRWGDETRHPGKGQTAGGSQGFQRRCAVDRHPSRRLHGKSHVTEAQSATLNQSIMMVPGEGGSTPSDSKWQNGVSDVETMSFRSGSPFRPASVNGRGGRVPLLDAAVIAPGNPRPVARRPNGPSLRATRWQKGQGWFCPRRFNPPGLGPAGSPLPRRAHGAARLRAASVSCPGQRFLHAAGTQTRGPPCRRWDGCGRTRN